MMHRKDRARDGAVADSSAVQGLREILRGIHREGPERLEPGDQDHRLRDQWDRLARRVVRSRNGRARVGAGALERLADVGGKTGHNDHYS